MRKKRVTLTGGGSGGHIYALLAVAEKLKEQAIAANEEIDIRYYGDAGRYTLEFNAAGIVVQHITESKIRQYFSLWNIVDLWKFAWSIPQTAWKLFWFMPDVTFSKGGPGAFVVVLVSWYYRIPIVIHDSDAIPGRTTRWTEKFAKKILLAFQSAQEYLVHKEHIMHIGNPIRTSLLTTEGERSITEKQHAKDAFEFRHDCPLLLVLGGSQGAAMLNDFVLENLEKLAKKYQILHQTGIDNFTEVSAFATELTKSWTAEQKKWYHPIPFLQADMKQALLAADIVISRAGAGAIFEIANAQLPAILVPITDSANNHQRENAFQYEEAGACIVIEEENLFGDIVINAIDAILENQERKSAMAKAAATFANPEAANVIAKEILKTIS